MADIFISYKRQRREAAQFVSDLLEAHGYSVWFDTSLLTGSEFEAQIRRQIDDAEIALILWCPLAVKSNWVKDEAELAREQGKNLDVTLTDDVTTTLFPLGTFQIERRDLSVWSGDPCDFVFLDPLISEIERRVKKTPLAIRRAKLLALSKQWRASGRRKLGALDLDEHDREAVKSTPAPTPTPTPPSAITQERPPPVFRAVSGDDNSPLMRRLLRSDGRPVAVGVFPVTVEEWRYAKNDLKLADEAEGTGSDGPRHPVVAVSWAGAKAYCKWLEEKSGRPYRLLSEAEWLEFAGTSDGVETFTGNFLHDDDDDGAIVAVDRAVANAYELRDMYGNSWEWVQNEDEDEDESIVNSVRVACGGSFRCAPPYTDEQICADFRATVLMDDIGFRVACDLTSTLGD